MGSQELYQSQQILQEKSELVEYNYTSQHVVQASEWVFSFLCESQSPLSNIHNSKFRCDYEDTFHLIVI